MAKDEHLHVFIHVSEFGGLLPERDDGELGDDTVPELLKFLYLVLIHDPLLVCGPEDSTAPPIDEV